MCCSKAASVGRLAGDSLIDELLMLLILFMNDGLVDGRLFVVATVCGERLCSSILILLKLFLLFVEEL